MLESGIALDTEDGALVTVTVEADTCSTEEEDASDAKEEGASSFIIQCIMLNGDARAIYDV